MINLVQYPKYFDECPEFGMGMHFGTSDGSFKNKLENAGLFVVFNSVFAVRVEELESAELLSLFNKTRDFFEVERSLPEKRYVQIRPCEDNDVIDKHLNFTMSHKRRLKSQGHIHGSPPFTGHSASAQRFVRFSAFPNDRRITARDGLLPGTFATSHTDASSVHTALSAVGHYALPNITAPQFRFEISPPPLTDLYYGTVSPNFGQSGGGTEIEFYRGVADGSVSGPSMIPVY